MKHTLVVLEDVLIEELTRQNYGCSIALGGSQQFAFAGVNLAIAQYELKEDEDAVKTLRKLLARYAEAFPDARAAYALILWDQGDRIEAATRKPTELNPCEMGWLISYVILKKLASCCVFDVFFVQNGVMSYYCTWYIRSVTAIPSHVLLHDEIIPFEYFFGGWMPVVVNGRVTDS